MTNGEHTGTFVLEAYLPRTCAGGPAAAAARARDAVGAMRREGTPIRVLRSFFMPEDELWFCLYEARSGDEVAEASRRAEISVGRIQRAEAVDVSMQEKRAEGSTR